HRALGTWQRKVSRFIALSEFSRGVFIAGGLPAGRIMVKPNFVADPLSTDVGTGTGVGAGGSSSGSGSGSEGSRAGILLFVGRLVADKGIATLAEIAAAAPELRIRVLGSGPEAGRLAGLANVELMGEQPAARV